MEKLIENYLRVIVIDRIQRQDRKISFDLLKRKYFMEMLLLYSTCNIFHETNMPYIKPKCCYNALK